MSYFLALIQSDHSAILPPEEARHCLTVLRKKVGDVIEITDGKGRAFRANIHSDNLHDCQLTGLVPLTGLPQRNFSLHIGIAPTKNMARFEWFLEKATELGIDQITPLLCAHSERKKIRLDRLKKIALSAMKQSKGMYLPEVTDLSPFTDFVQNMEESSAQKLVAHCRTTELPALKELVQPKQDVILLIGPEGDFSSSEVQLCRDKNWKEVSLGSSRLRTETAGLVACAYMHFTNT